MIAFHMFCHEDGARAREIARDPFADYLRAMDESTRDWADRKTESKDYPDYDKSMRKMRAATLEGQIE